MEWSNLTLNRCPKCGEDLSDKFDEGFFRCFCGFAISEEKFRKIVSGRERPARGRTEKHYRPEDEIPDLEP